jgi:hypothetical protein
MNELTAANLEDSLLTLYLVDFFYLFVSLILQSILRGLPVDIFKQH